MPKMLNSLYFIIFTVLSSNTIEGSVQLECDSLQCLSQEYEYQCNVTGSSNLLWRIRDENNMVLDDQSYTVGSTPSSILDPLGGAPEFSTTLNATSPSLISYTVFTAQSGINGYTIECDSLTVGSDTCPIVLADTPSAPEGITIHTDTFTNSSVDISWTESSSPCVTGYKYNVSSTASGWVNIIMESTSNSVTVEGLVPSDDPYSIVVTAIDTADRNSSGSDPACFIIDAPKPVKITSIQSIDSGVEELNIIVNWEAVDFDTTECSFPSLTGFRVSITSDNENFTAESFETSSSETTTHTFNDTLAVESYTITVDAINIVGSRSSERSYDPLQPTSSSSLATIASTQSTSISSSSSVAHSSTFNPTISMTSSTPTTSGTASPNPILSTGAVAGIAVAVVVIAILVIIVIILLVVYCCCLKGSHESDEPMPLKATKHPLSATQPHAQPETGQTTYQDPSTIEHKPAHTGDLYAQPDVSSKRRPPPHQPEQATYQDPDTIQRTQAHTGDLYAQPDKKSSKKAAQAQVYADLEMHSSVSPRSPQPLIQQDPQQQVMYSAVYHN